MSYGGNKEEDPYWRRKNRVADDTDSIGGVSATSHRSCCWNLRRW